MATRERLAVGRIAPLFILPLVLLLPLVVAEGLESSISHPCPTSSAGAGAAAACPVNCFRPDPVCGVDGVTYWCGCTEAACAGVLVAKRGFCQVGNGGAGLVSGQALLLVHIVWLIILGFAVLFGFV